MLTLRGTPGVRRGPDSGNLAIIEDGSVFIKDGKIASVGPTRRIENLKEARGALNIPVNNCVVMPGFVDPSIRLSLASPDKSGVLKRRKLSDFYNECLVLMRSCLQHGTLNAGIRASSGGRSLGADLSVLRQLARIGNNPIGQIRIWSPALNYSEGPAVQAFADMLQVISKRKLAHSLQLKGNSDRAICDALLPAAKAAELMFGVDWMEGQATGLRSELNRLSPVTVFCQNDLSSEECDELLHANSTAVFHARSNLFDRQPGGSLRKLVDAGGGIALGSGYDALYEPNYNMQLVLALAVMRLGLTLEQAIVATTVNAAYAINCGDSIGSLEPGKRADILVLNLNDYREIPRRMAVNHVAMAIRDGNLAINRTRWKVGAA